jgi:hypothetical protein
MQGYLHEECGPPALEGKGREAMARDVERIMKLGKERRERGGCPMAAWERGLLLICRGWRGFLGGGEDYGCLVGGVDVLETDV